MKSSNLALRTDCDESPPVRPGTETADATHALKTSQRRTRRPRRSLEFRTIVLSDQGFAPFRVR
jgi:hypothetical protein